MSIYNRAMDREDRGRPSSELIATHRSPCRYAIWWVRLHMNRPRRDLTSTDYADSYPLEMTRMRSNGCSEIESPFRLLVTWGGPLGFACETNG